MTGRVILAMDTVLAACSVAISRDGKILAAARHIGRRGHAERLPGMIEAVLAEAGLDHSDLTHYAVTRGPGSFAGIRVALSAARAMALVSGHPVIGLSSLQVVAAGITDTDRHTIAGQQGRITVLFDARRDQVYLQEFQPDAASTPLTEAVLIPIKEAQSLLSDAATPRLLAGSGAPVVLDGMDKTTHLSMADGLCDSETSPDAAHLAILATGADIEPGPVEPLYIRQPDAKLPGGIDPS